MAIISPDNFDVSQLFSGAPAHPVIEAMAECAYSDYLQSPQYQADITEARNRIKASNSNKVLCLDGKTICIRTEDQSPCTQCVNYPYAKDTGVRFDSKRFTGMSAYDFEDDSYRPASSDQK